MSKGGATYILTNERHTTLYVGVSAELKWRIIQHKEKHDPKSFTAKYNLNKLVHYELFDDIEPAIEREKQLKSWSRNKKLDLIEANNPEWRDLFEDIKEW